MSIDAMAGWATTGTDRSAYYEPLSEAQARVVASYDEPAYKTFTAQLDPLASHG